MFNVMSMLSDVWLWVKANPEKITTWIRNNPVPFTILATVSVICAAVVITAVFA